MAVPAATSVTELPTPALLLDVDVLDANLRAMQRRADRLGVALRPHAKTHKCLEVARRQRDLGARGLTVATLAEARFFLGAGVRDVTWAFPLVLSRLGEARELVREMDGATLRLVVDSSEATAVLEGQEWPFHVFLKVDCGYGRCGVDPAGGEAVELARRISAAPHLTFDGLLSHSGHAYGVTGRAGARRIAEEERRVMVELAKRLRDEGMEVPSVSVGSTPAMTAVEDLNGVTEARPGNYCFFDATQAALGSCTPADCALTVLTSVVSTASGHAVVDAGALALSKDPGPGHLPWPNAMGAVFPDLAAYRAGAPEPGLHLTSLSQEHGKLSRPLAVGTKLRVLPNHSCLTVPNFPGYHLVRNDDVVGWWGIFQGR